MRESYLGRRCRAADDQPRQLNSESCRSGIVDRRRVRACRYESLFMRDDLGSLSLSSRATSRLLNRASPVTKFARLLECQRRAVQLAFRVQLLGASASRLDFRSGQWAAAAAR